LAVKTNSVFSKQAVFKPLIPFLTHPVFLALGATVLLIVLFMPTTEKYLLELAGKSIVSFCHFP